MLLNERGFVTSWHRREEVTAEAKAEARKQSASCWPKAPSRWPTCPMCHTAYAIPTEASSIYDHGLCKTCKLWDEAGDRQESATFAWYQRVRSPTVDEIMSLPVEKLTGLHAKILRVHVEKMNSKKEKK